MSSWAGERQRVNCGGLSAGVGRPLLVKKLTSLVIEKLRLLAISIAFNVSVVSSNVMKPWSPAAANDVQLGTEQGLLLDSSDSWLAAGEGMDCTEQAVPLTIHG